MGRVFAARSQDWRYGIVFDAGSSGTRLHIYRWLDNAAARSHAKTAELQALPVIETKKKWTEKIHPGVSTFGDKPHRVGPDHLEKLFEKAREIVPDEEAERTPMFLLATAGMRLLDDEVRDRLLEQICTYAQTKTRFQLPDCGIHIKVIPGEVEGLYGWLAANYLLGGFDSPDKHANANDYPTYGFLDMGGASAQIAFAPNSTVSEEHADDLRLIRLRTVDGKPLEYKVFTTTWLGFGVNQARQHFVESLQAPDGMKHSNILEDPCLPRGLTTSTKGDIFLPGSKEVNGKVPYLKGTGDFEECLKKTYPLLEKDAVCKDDPCLIGGTHVPPIDFNVNHFVGVSEYWHTTHEIFEVGHKDKAYDFNTYQQRVSDFCSRDWSKIEESINAHEWGKKVDEKTAIEVCFKASWLINVLHDGIGVPRVGLEELPSGEKNGTKQVLDNAKDKGFIPSFRPINKIDDTEVSWTLGKIVLYASSQVLPSEDSALPVGFGSNVPGIPSDFQYPGSLASNIPSNKSSTTHGTSDRWSSSILHTATLRRLPGMILFLLIFALVGYFLCGRTRRQRIYNRFSPAPSQFSGSSSIRSMRNTGGKSRSLFGSKRGLVSSIFRPGSRRGPYERVLEEGSYEESDYELGRFADESGTGGNDLQQDYNDASDSSSGDSTSKNSGWATPRLRGTASHTNLGSLGAGRTSSDALSFLGKGQGLGLGLGAMSGVEAGKRSRRVSPNRHGGLGSLIED